MFSVGKKQKRFSLLFLEDGEIYTRDCMGYRYHPESFPDKRQEKGRLHLCSRSLMFEPDDTETPLVRYSFRDIPEAPLEVSAHHSSLSNTENTSRVSFRVSKMTILPHPKYPAQYRGVTFDKPQIVQLEFVYETAASICTWINDLYARNSKNSPGFDVDAELADLVIQRERGIRFDMSRIESITEKPLVQAPYLVKRIHPFMSLAGLLFVTDQRVYFQPVYRVSAKPVKSVRYDQIVKLYRRRYKLRNIGFELYTSSHKSLFISFYSEKERDQIYSLLISLVSPECETEGSVENMTLKWQLKQMSNFDYLLYLNSAAYRTVSDFTQYPVFPWVIADYASSELNLNNPSSFRDLSKPIGALNPDRLNNYKLRYNEMPEPKFLYGTHYSVPGYVIGFLFRKFPLYMLRLHSGRFDSPDRLFNEIASEWRNVLENPADVKELTPEFYMDDPSFLLNSQHLDLGVRYNGEKVGDIKLPVWAKDPEDYLKKMREALESNYVSENLHHWIDLIFGSKQRGEAALQADNLFHPLTYEGNIDIESISDPIERRAFEIQINEFGQTPKQLFKIPHPPRSPIEEESKQSSYTVSSIRPLWKIEAVARKSEVEVKEITLHKKYDLLRRISSIHKLENRVITTGHDGCIKVVGLDTLQKRSFTVCDLALSSSAIVDSSRVVTGSYDNKVYLFSIGTGRVQDAIGEHDDAVTCVEYIPALNVAVSSSWDAYTRLWDIRANKLHCAAAFEDHEEQITSMSADPLGENPYQIVTGDLDGKVVIRDLRAGKVLSRFQTHSHISSIAYSMYSKHLVISTPNAVSLYDYDGQEAEVLSISGVSSLATDGIFVLTGKEEGNLELWSLMKGNCMYAWRNIGTVTSVASDSYGESFFAGTLDGMLYYIP